VTANPGLSVHLPSKRQVQRTAAELAASLAVELVVVGVVGVVRGARRARGIAGVPKHRLLRALVAEFAAEGVAELATQRARMMFELDRRLDEQMLAGRRHR
jgi:hypothetical protein